MSQSCCIQKAFLSCVLHPYWLLTVIQPHFLQNSLSSVLRDFTKSSHLKLGVTKSPTLFTWSRLYCSPLLLDRASLMMEHEHNEMSSEGISVLHSICRAIVFGFSLGLWPIQSQVLSHTSNVQAWVLFDEIGIYSNDIISGHSNKFCATIIPACLAARLAL